MTSTWCNASSMYKYFADPNNGYINGTNIWLDSMDKVNNVKSNNGVQVGDLLFFYNKDEGVHHVAIITGFKEDGGILYSAHSNDRINAPITDETLKYDSLIIIKMKDDAK